MRNCIMRTLPSRKKLLLTPMRRSFPKMGDSELEFWEIDAPKNLWNIANAQRLLGCYNVVDYPTMTTDDVWGTILEDG